MIPAGIPYVLLLVNSLFENKAAFEAIERGAPLDTMITTLQPALSAFSIYSIYYEGRMRRYFRCVHTRCIAKAQEHLCAEAAFSAVASWVRRKASRPHRGSG